MWVMKLPCYFFLTGSKCIRKLDSPDSCKGSAFLRPKSFNFLHHNNYIEVPSFGRPYLGLQNGSGHTLPILITVMYDYADLTLSEIRTAITGRNLNYIGKILKHEHIAILCKDDLEKINQKHIDFDDQSDPTGTLRSQQNLREYEERCQIHRVQDDARLKYHEDEAASQRRARDRTQADLTAAYHTKKSVHDLHVRNLARLQQNAGSSQTHQGQEHSSEVKTNQNSSEANPDLKPSKVESAIEKDHYYEEPCIFIASEDYEVRGDRIPHLEKITAKFRSRHIRCDSLKYILTFGRDQGALQRAHDCVSWLRSGNGLFSHIPMSQRPHIPVFFKDREHNRSGPINPVSESEDDRDITRKREPHSANTPIEKENRKAPSTTSRDMGVKTGAKKDAIPTPRTSATLDSGDNHWAELLSANKITKRKLSSSASPAPHISKKPHVISNKTDQNYSSDAPGHQTAPRTTMSKYLHENENIEGLDEHPELVRAGNTITQTFEKDAPYLVLSSNDFPAGGDIVRVLVQMVVNEERKQGRDFYIVVDESGYYIVFWARKKGRKLAYQCWKDLKGVSLLGRQVSFNLVGVEEVDEMVAARPENTKTNLTSNSKETLPGDSGVFYNPVLPTLEDHPYLLLTRTVEPKMGKKKPINEQHLLALWATICNKKLPYITNNVACIKKDDVGIYIGFFQTEEGAHAAAKCYEECFPNGWRGYKNESLAGVVQ